VALVPVEDGLFVVESALQLREQINHSQGLVGQHQLIRERVCILLLLG